MAQYARPDADSDDGDWLNQDDGSSLYESIDESSADDNTSYIYCGDGESTLVCKVGLSNVSSPASGNAYIKYRALSSQNGMDTLSLKVELMQDSAVKFTSTTSSVATSYTNYSYTISDHSSITDWDALFLRFTLFNSQGMGDTLRITQAYVETPDAGGGGSTPIAAIAMNTYRQLRN